MDFGYQARTGQVERVEAFIKPHPPLVKDGAHGAI
jgi:hypothetical protein